jgi:hypothetical protein
MRLMSGRKPNITERKLEELVEDALLENFQDEAVVDHVMTDLYKSGAFVALIDYIEAELENPSAGSGPVGRT